MGKGICHAIRTVSRLQSRRRHSKLVEVSLTFRQRPNVVCISSAKEAHDPCSVPICKGSVR